MLILPAIKVFFYNPSTRTSVWERPPELYGRADVDVLVSKPPESEWAPEERSPVLEWNIELQLIAINSESQPVKKRPPAKRAQQEDEDEEEDEGDVDEGDNVDSDGESAPVVVKKKNRKEKKCVGLSQCELMPSAINQSFAF